MQELKVKKQLIGVREFRGARYKDAVFHVKSPKNTALYFLAFCDYFPFAPHVIDNGKCEYNRYSHCKKILESITSVLDSIFYCDSDFSCHSRASILGSCKDKGKA